jgi:hypothetical protein
MSLTAGGWTDDGVVIEGLQRKRPANVAGRGDAGVKAVSLSTLGPVWLVRRPSPFRRVPPKWAA